ncbi:TPA: hypothetical protein ACXNGW_006371, partial [Pseudomonas aeruginosa]
RALQFMQIKRASPIKSSLMGSTMRHACGFFKTNRMLMCPATLPPCHPATLPPCHPAWRWAKLFALSAKVKRFGQS